MDVIFLNKIGTQCSWDEFRNPLLGHKTRETTTVFVLCCLISSRVSSSWGLSLKFINLLAATDINKLPVYRVEIGRGYID
ncbi:hypothetical protein YC2023_124758 [Brassica napus]